MKIERSSPLLAPASMLGTLRLLVILAVAAMLVSQSTAGQQPALQKLTLSQIEGLVSHSVPDSTLHTAIMTRGLAFTPTGAILEALRAKGAGPLVLSDIGERIPGGAVPSPETTASGGGGGVSITLVDARRIIPVELTTIFQALNDGNPQGASRYLAPDVAGSNQRLDSICRPFTYRAHSIEAIIERPNGMFEARVRVLYKPFDERGLVLKFRIASGVFQLVESSDWLDEWFGPSEETAAQMARKFIYAAKAHESSVLPALVDSGIDVSRYTADPCWREALARITGVDKVITPLEQFHGLKIHATAVVTIDTAIWMYSEVRSDFWIDRVGSEYKIVAMTLMQNPAFIVSDPGHAPEACRGVDKNFFAQVQAPGLERRTLARFGLASGDEASSQTEEQSQALGTTQAPQTPTTPAERLTLSPDESRKLLLSKVGAVYPPIAKAAQISGTVVLEATISTEGAIENLRVVSGPAMLQQSALNAVKQWRYRPYLLNNTPVEVETTVNVVFSLNQ
jgi:TonB family protein